MKKCISCGCLVEDDARFCTSCGTDVSQVPAGSADGEAQGGVMSIFLKYASVLNEAQLYKVAIAKEMGVIQSAPGEVQEIYRVLAFRGHLDSMYRYAELCIAGGDKLTAYKWFKVAADAGHEPSKTRLESEDFFDTMPTKAVSSNGDGQDSKAGTITVTINTEEALENPNRGIEIPSGSGDFVTMVNDAMRGVVMITAVQVENGVRMVSRGSGFIVDGLVITNAHVVGSNPSCVQANFEPSVDSRTYNLLPLTILPEYDISVLKFTNYTPTKNFNLRIGGVKFGESVYTIGNPLGVGLSVSKGIVSNPNRKNTFASGEYHSKLETVIQTDIVSNHGNSGGAIFDMNNNVIAMLTFEPSKSEGGMSMCVPAEYIQKIIKTVK